MRELKSAIMKQASGKNTYIIPIMIEGCELPEIISDICYADFISDYQTGLKRLIESISSHF